VRILGRLSWTRVPRSVNGAISRLITRVDSLEVGRGPRCDVSPLHDSTYSLFSVTLSKHAIRGVLTN
jgi:hypothetical protein